MVREFLCKTFKDRDLTISINTTGYYIRSFSGHITFFYYYVTSMTKYLGYKDKTVPVFKEYGLM